MDLSISHAVVGVIGVEPTASCSPNKRSTDELRPGLAGETRTPLFSLPFYVLTHSIIANSKNLANLIHVCVSYHLKNFLKGRPVNLRLMVYVEMWTRRTLYTMKRFLSYANSTLTIIVPNPSALSPPKGFRLSVAVRA